MKITSNYNRKATSLIQKTKANLKRHADSNELF